MKLEEIVKIITSDLNLNISEQIEFKNQFMELFVYNLLLNIPDQYKDGIENLMNDSVLRNQIILVEKITTLGVIKEEATNFINDSIKKSISEVIRKYDDVFSPAT